MFKMFRKQQDKQVKPETTVDELVTKENLTALFGAFKNLAVCVVDEKTKRFIYYNQRFAQHVPNARVGMTCYDVRNGSCDNCPVREMGEQMVTRAIVDSTVFGQVMELSATRFMWDENTRAMLLSFWPSNVPSTVGSDIDGEIPIDRVCPCLTRPGIINYIENMHEKGIDMTKYAVAFINIDGFKALNDMFGYSGGNELLRSVYNRVENSFLEPLVGARSEADHFVFVVPRDKIDYSQLRKLLNFHWLNEDKDIFVHTRCGIFLIDDESLPAFKMLDRAKLAKQYIEDDYVQPYKVYDRSMLAAYEEQVSAVAYLDDGINKGQFKVYFQPIVDAMTGKPIGSEALVRRVLDNGTVVSPAAFVPMLERTGYISKLDKFVTQEVIAFQSSRYEKGLPILPVSVNLSRKDFYDEEILNYLKQSLEAGLLPKDTIRFEMTESAYCRDEHKNIDFISALRRSGSLIILDDFGTGYSSFGTFTTYSFDVVKLDMSFTRVMAENENVRFVVNSIIDMCHKLDIKVVAEGVENEQQLEMLRGMQCDYIQGYYFSRPLTRQGYEEYLLRENIA